MNVADVRAAHARIAGFVHRTPVLTSRSLDARLAARIYFKCENLQRGGAFKIRGALNAALRLAPEKARRGLATHSSGNHGAAVAIAARHIGAPAWVVVPTNAAHIKRAAMHEYGASLVDCEPSQAAREATLADLVARTGAAFVPPYDDDAVIAGQGTAALELLEDVPGIDAIWAPVGGGGLVSGTALAARGFDPPIEVIGAEPVEADDARRSLELGVIQPSCYPDTIADGLRTSLGERTFAVMRREGVRIVTATERSIVAAMRLVWERMKLVIEPSAAVPLAAMLEHPDTVRGRRVGVILSGGNVDLDRFFSGYRVTS